MRAIVDHEHPLGENKKNPGRRTDTATEVNVQGDGPDGASRKGRNSAQSKRVSVSGKLQTRNSERYKKPAKKAGMR